MLLLADAVSVATVQATVVAIFTAIGVGYFAIAYERLYGMKHELIEKANAAGRERPIVIVGHPLADDGYDGRDDRARWRFQNSIRSVVLDEEVWTQESAGAPRDRVVDASVPRRVEPSERGDYLLDSLSLILITYPLRIANFTTLKDVRAWLADARPTSRVVLGALQESMPHVTQLVSEAKPPDFPPLAPGQSYRPTLQRLFPEHRFEEYYEALREINREQAAADEELRRYDGYKRRLPRREWLAAGFVAAVLAFVTGVLLPLIDTHPPRGVYVGIPIALYAGALTVAGYLVLKGSYDA